MNGLEATDQTQPYPINTVARMRDVAQLAGVSMATVSNVLNHPHLVAKNTQTKVLNVVREMNFEPDPNARALRTSRTNRTSQPTVKPDIPVPDAIVQTGVDPGADSKDDSLGPLPIDNGTKTLVPGMHACLQVGQERVSGVVDAVMADESCVWLWSDGGMGRRMVHLSEADILSSGPSNEDATPSD